MSLRIRNGRTPFEKEWDALCKREKSFLERRKKKKETALNQFLENKVPEKLQSTLDGAFAKAFSLIFEKGTGVIEKTYNREKIEKEYQVSLYAGRVYDTRKSLKVFSRKARKAGGRNLALSGVSGIGMGLLGIGLPDIPLFTGMILKCVYEIALNFGVDYQSQKERYFILLLIEGAVSYGEELEAADKKIETFMEHPGIPAGCGVKEQMKNASAMLSKELLYMKFLQGIPVAGAIGGAYDAVYMKQISQYAEMKYHKRFLMKRKAELKKRY